LTPAVAGQVKKQRAQAPAFDFVFDGLKNFDTGRDSENNFILIDVWVIQEITAKQVYR